MFDTLKRLIWGDLQKDIVRKWAADKMEQEKKHADFIEKCKVTPSFSRCVIDNGTYKRIKHAKLEKSQKQKQQLKPYNLRSYKEVLLKDTSEEEL